MESVVQLSTIDLIVVFVKTSKKMSFLSLTFLMFVASGAVLGLKRNTELLFPNHLLQITNYAKYNHYVPAMKKGILCGEFQPIRTQGDFITFVSYATQDGGNYANQLLIGLMDGKLSMNVNGNDRIFNKYIDFTIPQKLCLTFDSETSKLTLLTASDNELEVIEYEGRTLLPGGTLIVGQEQDCVGGCFDPNQSYSGAIRNLVMTDFVDKPDYRLIDYPNVEVVQPKIILGCDSVDLFGKTNVTSYSYIY